MGCDIHLYAETLPEGEFAEWTALHPHDVGLPPDSSTYDGRWFHERDYALFAVLAGVRNYGSITPISPPRGLPDEPSFLVQAGNAFWGTDGHSHSWVMLGEVTGYPHWDAIHAESPWTDWPGHRWCDVIDALGTVDRPVRLVFWFDN